jgi:hypothetical protein
MAKNLSQVYVRPKFSKELRPHQLVLVPVRTMDMLRAPISRVEVRALGKLLIDMGRLVLAIARPDAQAETLDESLRSLAKSIEKRWEEGLAAHRLRTDLRDEERSISEFLARIQLSNADEIGKTADALLKEVNSTVEKLRGLQHVLSSQRGRGLVTQRKRILQELDDVGFGLQVLRTVPVL